MKSGEEIEKNERETKTRDDAVPFQIDFWLRHRLRMCAARSHHAWVVMLDYGFVTIEIIAGFYVLIQD